MGRKATCFTLGDTVTAASGTDAVITHAGAGSVFVEDVDGHIAEMRNLSDRRSINPDRRNDRVLVLITPPPPPLNNKNLAPHDTLHVRHVTNDVAMHVS